MNIDLGYPHSDTYSFVWSVPNDDKSCFTIRILFSYIYLPEDPSNKNLIFYLNWRFEPPI